MKNARRPLKPDAVAAYRGFDFGETPMHTVSGSMFGVRIHNGRLVVRDCGRPDDGKIDVPATPGGMTMHAVSDVAAIANEPTRTRQVAAILRGIGLPVTRVKDAEHVWDGLIQITPSVAVAVSPHGRIMFVEQRIVKGERLQVRLFDHRSTVEELCADLRVALGIAPEAALRLPA